jgi:hypothetical protein
VSRPAAAQAITDLAQLRAIWLRRHRS